MNQTAVAVDAPRRGRPALPPDERRTVDVRLRLSPREADAAYRLAIKHGKPLNDVLRAILRRLMAA